MRGIIGHNRVGIMGGHASIASGIALALLATERLKQRELDGASRIDPETCRKIRLVKDSTINISMAILFNKRKRKLK
jgi:hypothetical protein